ncbi:MAG: ATP-dependent sacrificial sulfur transferase LarE [Pseudomonadota bacterium]
MEVILIEDLTDKEKKLQKLITDLAADKNVFVAFSGGVDSSLLLLETVNSIGHERTAAITAVSPTSPSGQLVEAENFADALHVRLIRLETQECQDPEFSGNSRDRCYCCKLIRYKAIKRLLMEQSQSAVIFDGSHSDDDPSDRPGFKALVELGIYTPLRAAGLGKDDIRALLTISGFHKLAAKPAQPCLATRIPHGTPITVQLLGQIRTGEDILKRLGFVQFRLRTHGTWARIVLQRDEFEKILSDPEIRRVIVSELKKIGYETILLDLEAYGETG